VDAPQSWVLSLLARSTLWRWVQRKFAKLRQRNPKVVKTSTRVAGAEEAPSIIAAVGAIVKWIALVAIAAGSAWGAWHLIRLLLALPLHDGATHDDWVHVLLRGGVVFADDGGRWRSGRRGATGGDLDWVVAALVATVAADHSGGGELSRADGISLGDGAAGGIYTWDFGIGCIALMLLGAQWYILFNVIAGASAIPADMKEVADVYRMSRRQAGMQVYLPCVFPSLVTGMVTARAGRGMRRSFRNTRG